MDEKWLKVFKLLKDPTISEVEANGPNEFFIKRSGKREQIDIKYGDVENYFRGIEKSLVPVMESITQWNRNSYLFEGPIEVDIDNVPIQARCHIALPPATRSPQITIAKKSTSLATVDDIAARGSMSLEMLNFLKTAVKYKLNIAISGGTGSGKTTMLEAIAKYISPTSRVGIAEDTPELNLDDHPNKTFLHSVPWQPGMDPNNVATLDWCVQQFQRMRTDSLIIGETRGKEFASFLVAANSGMDGSMTTIHANNGKQCLTKMSEFALKGTDRQPMRSINNSIANAIDLIVQLTILPNGAHKVLEIVEVTNTLNKDENATISTETLYKYNVENDTFVKTGSMTDPLRHRLESKGANIKQFISQPIGTISKPEGQQKTDDISSVGNTSNATRSISQNQKQQQSGNPLQRRSIGLPRVKR